MGFLLTEDVEGGARKEGSVGIFKFIAIELLPWSLRSPPAIIGEDAGSIGEYDIGEDPKLTAGKREGTDGRGDVKGELPFREWSESEW